MFLEAAKAIFELVFLLADIGLVLTCCVFHFKRGELADGIVHGSITIALFYVAGLITNLFHFFRHESTRQSRRSGWKKVKCILLIFLPCYYLLRWSVKRVTKLGSLTINCWTSTLRIFYCSTGSLVQAVFQSYLVVSLWWAMDIPNLDYAIMITAAVYLSLHAVFGVCRYIWTQYYDEEHEYLRVGDFILIIFGLALNMSGRVTAMAVVMGTLNWYWLAVAVIGPFLINYAAYTHAAAQAGPHDTVTYCVCRYCSLVPLALLSSVTVSDQRALTVITTMAWVGCTLPYIINYHDDLSTWLVWLIPACAQIIALIVMLWKWSAFEAAFERFNRIARINKWTKVSINTLPKPKPNAPKA